MLAFLVEDWYVETILTKFENLVGLNVEKEIFCSDQLVQYTHNTLTTKKRRVFEFRQ